LREKIEDLRAAPLVDYRRGMAVRRRVFELLARCCFSGWSGRREAFVWVRLVFWNTSSARYWPCRINTSCGENQPARREIRRI